MYQVYPVGSKVWLKNMANSHRMGGKMDPVYTGPYTVAEVMDKGRYCLQKANGTRLKKLYNGVLLKEVLDPVDPSESSESAVQKSVTSTPDKMCSGSKEPIKSRKQQLRTKRSNPPSKKRKVIIEDRII